MTEQSRAVAAKALHTEKHWLDGHGGNCPGSCSFKKYDLDRLTHSAIDSFLAYHPDDVLVDNKGKTWRVKVVGKENGWLTYRIIPRDDGEKAT